MSIPTKPEVRSTWGDSATTSDLSDPGDAFVSAGWTHTTRPPPRQYFNWFFKWVMNGVRYLTRRGVSDYDAAETYMFGDIIRGDDGYLYKSLTNNNINNLPSTSLALWGSITFKSMLRTDSSQAPVTTESLNRNYMTTLRFDFHTNAYVSYKIATLPASTLASADSIRIIGTLNTGYAAAGSCAVDITLGNRSGFTYLWTIYGPNGTTRIQAATEADGTVNVFCVGVQYGYANLSIINVGSDAVASDGSVIGPSATVYPNAPIILGDPGTVVFDTANAGTYPPLINAPAASTYINAAQVATIYETQAAANAGIAAAISTAASDASTKQASAIATASADATAKANGAQNAAAVDATSKANTAYATAVAAAANDAQIRANGAQASAISTAAGDATAKMNNAIAVAEAYALATSSLATTGYQKLPSGLIIQWGSMPAQSTFSPSFGLPIPYPNECFGVWPIPVSSVVGNADICNLAAVPAPNTTLVTLNMSIQNIPVRWVSLGH